MKAATGERLVNMKHSLKMASSSKRNEMKELQADLALFQKRLHWQVHEEGELKCIKKKAAKELAKIEAKHAKEYLELFPPTCTKIDSGSDPIVTPNLNAAIMNALSELRADSSPTDPAPQKVANAEVNESIMNTRNDIVAKNPLGIRGVDAVQVSSHRGPPTDRPPDRPCIGKGVVRGCLQERAGTRHVSQPAFFARVGHSLSGNASPLQKMQIKAWTPSDCHASFAAANFSQDISRRVRSWRHTSGDRSRAKRDTCVTNGHLSSNLGRNLSLRGGFLSRTESAGSMAQRDNRRLDCTSPRPGLRVVVRCSQAPLWGQTK
jgi:hypothetical protein